MEIRFYELAGDDAERQLRDLGHALRGYGGTTRLLRSLDDPRLFLLVADGGTSPSPAVPAGCRTWSFTPLPDAGS